MHETFLERCFELAQQGETLASPNPIVGCVIVHDGKIIGEGYHRKAGEAHAEVNAISEIPENIPSTECVIYVSLEPCAHHGKTPPCSDLIIEKGFKELVFSSYDPNPEVSGKGIARIKEAGIKVTEPKDLSKELQDKSKFLNRKFLKWIAASPSASRNDGQWTTLKIALQQNGSMLSDGKWFTNNNSKKQVHRSRSTNDLLITGAKTVREDNPRYDVRYDSEELGLADIKNPDIAILYRENKITDLDKYQVFSAAPEREVFQTNNLEELLTKGYRRIMIETGPSLSEYLLKNFPVDEVIIFQNTEADSESPWRVWLKEQGFKLKSSEEIKEDELIDIKELWLK